MIKPKRKVKCKICQKKFERFNSFQRTCSPECAIEDARHQKRKEQRRDLREFNQKDKAWLMSKAQQLVNRYVRLRDKDKPCCTCGTYTGKFDSGHWLSAGGHGSVRFNTLNIHKQCYRDNRMKSGCMREYREFMVKQYGEEFTQSLELDGARPRKYTPEYLQKLIRVFKKKIKLIESRV